MPASLAAPAHSYDESLAFGDGRVLIHVPAHPGAVGVVVLHSLGNSASEPPRQGWSAVADRAGFIGIYPERGHSWNAGLCCAAAAQQNRDDVDWLARLIAEMQARFALRTVYLAGFSNGGMMVERLVAERPALSPCFAVYGAAPEMPTAGLWPGHGFLFEGSADTIVPPVGGVVMLGTAPALIRPARATARWLPRSRLTTVTMEGLGHRPPSDWPDRAWSVLRGCAAA